MHRWHLERRKLVPSAQLKWRRVQKSMFHPYIQRRWILLPYFRGAWLLLFQTPLLLLARQSMFSSIVSPGCTFDACISWNTSEILYL